MLESKEWLLLSGVLSIIVGSVGGVNQTKLKRLLGYSIIVSFGYITLGLIVGG